MKLSNIVIACAFAGAITQAPTVLAATDAQEKLGECSGAILTVDEPVWLSEQDDATKKRYRTKLLACTNWIEGMTDVWHLHGHHCYNGATFEQMARMYVKDMKENPEKMSNSGVWNMGELLEPLFECEASFDNVTSSVK
ncbi:MAG: hypothetical protein VB957_09640 [Pseudomonadales bacterium]